MLDALRHLLGAMWRELALLGLAVWAYVGPWFTPDVLKPAEALLHFLTMALAFALVLIRVIRLLRGKDDIDFSAPR